MLVLGGKNSSNSLELFKNVSNHRLAFFVESLDEVKTLIKNKSILPHHVIGLTGGTSATIEELLEIKDYLVTNFN